jgi:hypothetical protein
MKTKIFSYPSIVLATYGKPNSEIGRFSHFWQIKNPEKIQFQFLKFLFKNKRGPEKKRVDANKDALLLSTCQRFLPTWA